MDVYNMTWGEVNARAHEAASIIGKKGILYGVPRGGIHAALAMLPHGDFVLTEEPHAADVIVDDLIDSGATRLLFQKSHPLLPFVVLLEKKRHGITQWVSFPWERMSSVKEDGPQDNVRRLLQFIGEDPSREGLRETPDRVVKSYAELFAGYNQDPASVFKVFEDGACDEVVLLKDIEFSSFCEHHMLPFLGQAHVAYIPNGKVIGVSKLARLVDIFSRRLQIQERLTEQITEALDTFLQPKGSACILKAKHLCMSCRGVGKQHSNMVTSSMTGVFRENNAARQELLSLIYHG